MPWTPLHPNLKRHADRLRKQRFLMREACWNAKRRDIAVGYRLSFIVRIKFYLRTR